MKPGRSKFDGRPFTFVPYSQDEREFLAEQDRERRGEEQERFEQEESQKVAEWTSSNNKTVSLHFDGEAIYWKVSFRKFGEAQISGLRRPTQAEKAKNPDLHAVVQGKGIDDCGFDKGFVACLGLTRERYMALRARLER